MNPEAWNRTFMETLRGLDAALADKVQGIASANGHPVSGAVNERPDDHAVIFWALFSHLRADETFQAWIGHATRSKIPRGHLNSIIRISGSRTRVSSKQFSNMTRFYTFWIRANLATHGELFR
jgi:hypothetical protein